MFNLPFDKSKATFSSGLWDLMQSMAPPPIDPLLLQIGSSLGFCNTTVLWLSSFLPDAFIPSAHHFSISESSALRNVIFFTLNFFLNYVIWYQSFSYGLIITWAPGPDLCVFKTLDISTWLSFPIYHKLSVSNTQLIISFQHTGLASLGEWHHLSFCYSRQTTEVNSYLLSLLLLCCPI